MPVHEVIERETIRYVMVPVCEADPFNIENDCLNPAGHHRIISCGDVVCIHCRRVWP